MWPFNKKQSTNSQPKPIDPGTITSIQQLTPEQEFSIEDLFAKGMKPAEISADLGLNVDVIYRYKKLRMTAATVQAHSDQLDQVQKLRDQLKMQELEDELEEKKFDREMRRKERELDMKIRTLELRNATKEMLGGEDGSSNSVEDEIVLELLDTFRDSRKKRAGGMSTPGSHVQNGVIHITTDQQGRPTAYQMPQQPQQQQMQIENFAVDLNDEEIKEIIADLPSAYIKLAKKASDERVKDLIRAEYNVSEKSIDRAVQMLRNGELDGLVQKN